MINRAIQYTFSLLNVDYVQLSCKWNYQNVLSPYYRIYYIDDGEGEVTDLRQSVKLEPGHIYIIPSFTLCHLKCDNFLSQYFIQFFEHSLHGISVFNNARAVIKLRATVLDQALIKRLLQINPGRGINRSDNPKVYEKPLYYEQYQQHNLSQPLDIYTETQGIIMQLISRFLPFKPSGPSNRQLAVPNKIVDSLTYIEANLSEELSVNKLAAMVHQNVDYFSRQFKEYTGTRPVTYICEKRIERAQYLMATSDMTLSEIISNTGFDNLAYFSNSFKKHTGMSPSSYKKQLYLSLA
jgi:AraC-like DNA-binding protein